MIRRSARRLLSMLGVRSAPVPAPPPMPVPTAPASPDVAAPLWNPTVRADGSAGQPAGENAITPMDLDGLFNLLTPSAGTSQTPTPGALAGLRLDSLLNAITGLGGANDKGASARPAARQPLSYGELNSLYLFNGYARRLTDDLPKDCTRKGFRVEVEGEEGDPLADEWKRLKVDARTREAMQWARLFGRCVVLIVCDEEVPELFKRSHPNNWRALWLRRPLDLTLIRRVHNLAVFDRNEASASAYDNDPRSENFRRPLRWTLSGNGFSATEVHHSRVLHFEGLDLPPSMRQHLEGGWSHLEVVWDQIRNKTSLDQIQATVAQDARTDVLKTDLGAILSSDEANHNKFLTRLKTMAMGKSLLRMLIIDKDEDYNSNITQVTGYGELDERSTMSLAMVSSQPHARLSGDSPGGLNADGDSHRKLWDKVIAAEQTTYLKPKHERLVEMLFAQRDGPTSGQIPEKWKIKYNPLDEPTQKEEAEEDKAQAEVDQLAIDMGAASPEEIARSRRQSGEYLAHLGPYVEGSIEEPDEDMAAALQLVADRADGLAETIPAEKRKQRRRIPASAESAARKVLRWRRSHPDDVAGLDDAGLAIARLLAHEETITVGELIEINQWFAAHGETVALDPGSRDKPWRDGGYVAGLARGGQSMARFAARQVERFAQAGPSKSTRRDAADTAVLAIEVPADSGFHAAQQAALKLLPDLTLESWPHLTMLYLGAVREADVAKIEDAVRGVLERVRSQGGEPSAIRIHPMQIGHFGPLDGGEKGVPVVGKFTPFQIDTLHMRLLRSLAPWIAASQHPDFIPHATLGHLRRAMTPEESAALAHLSVAGLKSWIAGSLVLRRGGQIIARFPLESGRLDGEE